MTPTRSVAAALAGGALIVGLTACGNTEDQAQGPTVAEVQQQALANQPAPGAPKYPRLPAPDRDKLPLSPDPENYSGVLPAVPANQLQPGQDPVATALSRIQEIAATTADMSNKFGEARDYFRQAEPFLEAVDGKVDDDTWDELNAGFDDMHKALDEAAAHSNYEGDTQELERFRAGMVHAEDASGRIQLAVIYALDHYYDE